MIRTAISLAALAITMLFMSPAFAQMRVHVSSTAEDTVGNRLTFAIREGIRRSAAMTLVDREQDAFILVRIVTLDPDRNDTASSTRTIYSVVWTTKTLHDTPVEMYLTSSVGLCGARRVAQCADGLVADTDREASEVRGWLQNFLDRTKR